MNSPFRSNTWFVTGATGLVGSYIVKKLRENDLSVIALVRKTSPQKMIEWLLDHDVKLVFGDLLDPETYIESIATCDIVVHTAAAVQVRDKITNWEINYGGTEKLLQSMTEYGVKRIIHISTAGIYGPNPDGKISEDNQVSVVGPYLKSKYAVEQLFKENYSNLSYTIIRPPYIYGHPNFDRHVIPTLINKIPRSAVPKTYGHDPKIGFVHAEDIARLVFLAGSNRTTPSISYNVQSFSLPLSEMINQINSVRDSSTKIIPIPYFLLLSISWVIDFIFGLMDRKFGATKFIKFSKYNWDLSTTRALEELGWSPIHQEKKELEILMAEYVKNLKDDELEQDIRNMVLE